MAIACGCELKGGMPLSNEMAQAHLKHTIGALLYWELMRRPGEDEASWASSKQKLMDTRIALIDTIVDLYPEAKGE